MMTFVLFPDSTHEPDAASDVEDRIARLTDAAYQAALQHGVTGSFVDVQLGIWSAIRKVLEEELSFNEDFLERRREHRQVPAWSAGVG
jgi:hypothetical protein